MQEIDNILDQTKKQIKRVEAPDYILTRVRQEFENLKEVATPKFIWSTVFATMLLLLLNIYVIGQNRTYTISETEINPEMEEIMASSSNQLYGDE